MGARYTFYVWVSRWATAGKRYSDESGTLSAFFAIYLISWEC